MHVDETIPSQRLVRISRRAQAAAAEQLAQRTRYAAALLRTNSAAAAVRASAEDCGEETEERRQCERRATPGSEILFRRIGGFNFQARIDDVSMGGCRVELIENCEQGEDVITRFPELEPIGARVCWSAGTTAGVQFSRAMHPAVFESVLIRLGAPA
jgi:hypothetical protein